MGPGPELPRGRREDPGLTRELLRWFRRSRRPLPWRSSGDPYRIWVSEVLLQQTTVAHATPYFRRFVRRFPTVASLARARESEVLKLWQGAGYYSRARNLREAARQIVREHDGQLPRSVEELEALPGVGPYIARAVASLAFGVPCVALEANGLRVAARWFREEGRLGAVSTRRRLEARLAELLPTRSAGRFNEALMELGETVCRPARPACPVCPVSRHCRARRELPDPAVLPRREARARPPHVHVAVVAWRRGDGRWLLQRRPSDGLLGGLWEFPGGKLELGESPSEAARREFFEEVGVDPGPLETLGVVRHAYSHFSVTIHSFTAATVGSPRLRRVKDRRWVSRGEIDRLALPRATEKVLELLDARPVAGPTGHGAHRGLRDGGRRPRPGRAR